MTTTRISFIAHPNAEAAARRLVATSALWGLVEVNPNSATLHTSPPFDPRVSAAWEALRWLVTSEPVSPFALLTHPDVDDADRAAVVNACGVLMGHEAEVRAA